MYKLSKSSIEKLNTCDPLLIKLITEAIKDSPVDFKVTEGYRDKDTQEKAFKNGYTKVHYPNSKHNLNPAKAVDIVPYPELWDAPQKKWEQLAAHIKSKAKELGIIIEYGGDWVGGWDKPHWQIK